MTHHAFIDWVAFYCSRRRFLPEQYYNIQIMQMFVLEVSKSDARSKRIPNPDAGKAPSRTHKPKSRIKRNPVPEAAKSSSQGRQIPAPEADKSPARSVPCF